jgi:hypothetical protein
MQRHKALAQAPPEKGETAQYLDKVAGASQAAPEADRAEAPAPAEEE